MRATNTELQLQVETLEPRMMLSTVEIIAAGTTNQEIIELEIGGQTVASFSQLGTGANDGQFQTRTFTTAANVTADDVRIQFTNDLLDTATGADRNVRIDAIVIDGVRFETEAQSVFSTGTFVNADGIAPGFGRGDILHANGFFQYAGGGGNTTSITVNARGTEGTETFALQIDGETVQTFENIGTNFSSFNFEAAGNITADQIRVVFLNDVFDAENGIFSDLVVDDIVVGGVQFETEAPNVFSTGTFRAEDGVVAGFGRGDTLHANGFFQFSSQDGNQPTAPVVVPTTPTTSITVNARGNEGFESFALQIDGQTVQTFENIGTNFSSFNFEATGNVTADQIRVVFLNDVFDAENNIFSDLIVDDIVVGGVQFETESPNVFSTGTFRVEDGVVAGFGRGDTLHANGFFQFSSQGVNQPTAPVEGPTTPTAGPTTSITVNARGTEGTETFALQIDGETVQTFENIGTNLSSFNFEATGNVTADQIRVVFLNDVFDATNGIFSDLVVDDIVVGGVQFETEAANVFSTGTFRVEDGVVAGFGRGDTLHANGFFQFSSQVVEQPPAPVEPPPAPVEPPPAQPAPVLSSGDGLLAEYFLGRDFDEFVRSGVESTVDFNFDRGGPDGLPDDNFSIRFTGQVEALYSELYTFETTSDDGVRLFVNGELIIDNFTNHAATLDRGTIFLEAGVRYDIRLEYYERTGRAIIQLGWSSDSQDREIISQSQLYSSSSVGQGPVVENPVVENPVVENPVDQSPVPENPVLETTADGRVRVTYFVSTNGSDNFNEEQAQDRSTAFRTIQRAVDAAIAGDTIIVLDGTYSEEIFLRRSGNLGEEIVIRAENQEGARLLGFIHGRETNHIVIDGFDITNSDDGVITQGIVFFDAHHITITNNLVRDSFGGGISFNGSDSILIEGNTTSGNAFFSPDAHSGISIFQPQRREEAEGEYGVIIRNNISFNNFNIVGNQNCCSGRPTDGNGIVLDDYQNSQQRDGINGSGIDYDRRTLVENNITFANGGNGIHVFRSHDIDIRNNTSVDNLLNLNNGAQINVSSSRDVNIYNNIVSEGDGLNAVRTSNSSRVTLEFNIIDGPDVGFSSNSTNFNTAPDFVPGTFELRAGAIGVDDGRDIDDASELDVLGQDRVVGRIDIGAVERQS